ncbi:MAG: hypothetical protein NC082_02515 [Clostridiales bacterium]|nr:hypothetical protein [Clostridiales bacterium]
MKKLLLVASFMLAIIGARAQSYNLNVTKNDGQKISIPTADISRIDFVYDDGSMIKADLLDVEFRPDGSAVDVSPMANEISYRPSANLVTYYNDIQKRYVASFRNPMGSDVTSGFYRINYTAGGNFINKIADGCTMETIIKLNTDDNPNLEVKWFSSMEAGGIGFILPVHAAHGDKITFLPNTSTSGASTWRWTPSKVKPEVGKYYHVVGVWNKEEGKSYIYINGQLSGQADAPGNYKPVNTGAEAFIIGGDPSTNPASANACFNGEVAAVRVYDKPMTQQEVAQIWEQNRFDPDAVGDMNFTDIIYMPTADVATGAHFSIYGNGFKEGDAIIFTTAAGKRFETVTSTDAGKVTATIPAGMVSDSYNIIVKRGNTEMPLGQVKLNIVSTTQKVARPKVIAHRGAHTDGATENSIAALRKAMDANYYGIEFDCWITTDGTIVVHHDGVAQGKTFQNCTYEEIKNIKLANGETLPTFDDYLKTFVADMDKSTSKLIIEIKTHSKASRNNECVDKVMSEVERLGIKDRVEYIAFDFNVCQRIVARDPHAMVGYLSGDRNPAAVKQAGIPSIDYYLGNFNTNPQWVKEAQELGMIVNVWTVNSPADMLNLIYMGVDYITTDYPATVTDLNSKVFVE